MLTVLLIGPTWSSRLRILHGSEEKGPNVQTASTATKYNATQPEWREKFHLCVFESNQVLKLVIAHNMEYSACPPSYRSCFCLLPMCTERCVVWQPCLLAF